MTGDKEQHGQVDTEQTELLALVEARFAKSMAQPEAFFTAEAGRIAEACWAMARRFHQGGRLLAFGNGASATDAQHVAVEFVHPVIVGKRALPALALTNDSATLSGLMAGGDATGSFAHLLHVLARSQDIAIGFALGDNRANIMTALAVAREMGLLTLGMLSGEEDMSQQTQPEYCFVVPSQDPLLIQEIHETLYHILWELVHIYFEHEGLLQ
jgi:D-sedoheptulose 7-phosphate isomerase